MTLAILCAGQGRQHPDMFAATAEAEAAAPVFAAATRLLGEDPRDLVRRADADLHANRTGQILCCTQALAAFAALRPHLQGRLVIAGYSVGELAAWGCAGVYDPANVLALAGRRAEAMDAAGGPDEGLAFVRGLSRGAVDQLCETHDAAVAIVNPADTYVVGGARQGLDALCAAALAAGAAKAGPLDVRVAAHTPRLAAAVAPFRAALDATAPKAPPPNVRLLAGVDASRVRTPADGSDRLARQIATTIDWAGCLAACAEAGVDTYLELGPGRALTNMVTALDPRCRAHSLDDFRGMAGVSRWLEQAGG